MQLMVLDYETYYGDDYTLSNMSTSAYVMDPRFEMIGVGIRYGDKRAWLEEYQWRAFARTVDWSQIAMLCHHAHFDGLINSYHYGVRPGYWFDTLSMGRALNGVRVGGSLGKLSEYYGVGVKGDESVKAKGKHRVDFTPEEWQAYGGYCLNDDDLAFGIFQKMLPSFPRKELDLIDMTVRMFTEPVLVLDQQKMAEYLAYELKRKEELLTEANADKKVLGSNDKFAGLLRLFNVEPPVKFSPKKKNADGSPALVYAFAKTDPGMQELLEHEDDDVRLLAEARISVKSTLNESRTVRMLNLGMGGRPMPVYLNYAGAKQTYRWSGGDKMNWQNMEKPNKKNPLKGMVRKSVRAPKGKKIVKADASQVEARFNSWFSKQDDLTAQFANGEDVYSLFASDAYGRKVDRKANPEDELPGQVAKICVLGLGYRMGYLKLAGELLMGRGGAPKVQFTREDMVRLNIDPSGFLSNPRILNEIKNMPSRLPEAERMIHCTVTNYFVQTYRRKMDKIVSNWEYWDEVIKWMFSGQYVGAQVGPHGILTLVEDGLLMPHGLVLRYPHIEYSKEAGFSFLSDKGQRKRFHGGFVVENYTQALCRVIVSDAMHELTWKRQRAGLEPYKIAQTEHDAISCVIEEERAGECLNDLMRAISTPPAFAKGLPLAAEGGIYDTMGG
jgi:DNA polymerase